MICLILNLECIACQIFNVYVVNINLSSQEKNPKTTGSTGNEQILRQRKHKNPFTEKITKFQWLWTEF